jgi:hypothetical protein
VIDSLGKRLLLAALAASLLIQLGCNGGRKSYQVSGKAQYKGGAPITGGVRAIRFEPTSDSTAELRKVASGSIGPDGSFEMYTRQPGDGVIAGKYVVTFTVLDKAMGGTSLIMPKYGSAADSPFEITVDGNKTDLLYELDKQ